MEAPGGARTRPLPSRSHPGLRETSGQLPVPPHPTPSSAGLCGQEEAAASRAPTPRCPLWRGEGRATLRSHFASAAERSSSPFPRRQSSMSELGPPSGAVSFPLPSRGGPDAAASAAAAAAGLSPSCVEEEPRPPPCGAAGKEEGGKRRRRGGRGQRSRVGSARPRLRRRRESGQRRR
jgi:hypothetical protein